MNRCLAESRDIGRSPCAGAAKSHRPQEFHLAQIGILGCGVQLIPGGPDQYSGR